MRKRFSLVQAVLGLLIFVFVFVTPLVVHREGLSAQEKAETSQTNTKMSKPKTACTNEKRLRISFLQQCYIFF